MPVAAAAVLLLPPPLLVLAVLVVLDQPLEVPQGRLESVRYFRPLLLRVAVAAGQDRRLKTVRLAGQAVVALRMVVLVVLVLVVKETAEPQTLVIKPVVVVALVLPDQLMAMAATEQHLVFLVPPYTMAVVGVVAVVLLKHLLVRVVQVVVVRDQVILSYLQRVLQILGAAAVAVVTKLDGNRALLAVQA